MTLFDERLKLFPLTTSPVIDGNEISLSIAGCGLKDLALLHGTPLYLIDQYTLDEAVRCYRQALFEHYPAGCGLTYAGKAFLCSAMAQWADKKELWIDCTGAGEIHIAMNAKVRKERILVHGVNKSPADLEAAIKHAGIIVVDNLAELELLHYYTWHIMEVKKEERPKLWLRLRPGISVETHTYTQTGHHDSKFGMGMDEASKAVIFCLEREIALEGIHFHLGSQFRDPGPIGKALEMVLDWLKECREQTGWYPESLSPGGGWGMAYHEDDLPHPSIEDYIGFITHQITEGCVLRNLPLPWLQIEPGRSLIAQAGVALYMVGNVKKTPQRRWILVDGGLADNPRPALYGTRYSALPVVNPERPAVGPSWIAGPFCESGDILIEGLPLPDLKTGELIAIPMSGAYHLSMSSNYNGACKPAVVWLKEGAAHLVQRREVPSDLTRRDILLPE